MRYQYMYNKLFTKILDSSVWLEDNPTRIVWMTLLAAMDEDGFCQFASVANLAHRARITREEAAHATSCLEGPDPDSSDPANEGRRIERVEGGWMVLNGPKYRELVTREVIKEQTRARVARYRERQKVGNGEVTQEKRDVTTSEAPALASARALSKPDATTKAVAWSSQGGWVGISDEITRRWGEAFPACGIKRQLAAMDQWLRANPTKSKKSNYFRFATNWLSRAQDRGGDTPANLQPKPEVNRIASPKEIYGS